LKLTTDRHEASLGLFATAELFVISSGELLTVSAQWNITIE